MISTYVLSPENAADENIISKVLFYTSILSQILMAFVFIILFNIRLSDELKEQIKNRDKFFSIISHDLNGPVGTIAEMLKIINHSDLFNQKSQTLLLNELEKLSCSTWLLLQNLLQWSRNQINSIKVAKKTFDLNELINQNITLLEQAAKSKLIELKYVQSCETSCFADPMMVDTILRNLISNAIKFTPHKGTIELSCNKTNSYAIITVKDSGKGISQEIADKLERNEQLLSTYGTDGEKGAGIGLSLCKDFVEKNNGTMDVRSYENTGTEISIKLPLDLNI